MSRSLENDCAANRPSIAARLTAFAACVLLVSALIRLPDLNLVGELRAVHETAQPIVVTFEIRPCSNGLCVHFIQGMASQFVDVDEIAWQAWYPIVAVSGYEITVCRGLGPCAEVQ